MKRLASLTGVVLGLTAMAPVPPRAPEAQGVTVFHKGRLSQSRWRRCRGTCSTGTACAIRQSRRVATEVYWLEGKQ